jgi:hypothetical protein
MVSVGTGCFTPPLKYNFQLYHPKWQKTKSQSLILLIQTDVYPLNQKSKVMVPDFFALYFMRQRPICGLIKNKPTNYLFPDRILESMTSIIISAGTLVVTIFFCASPAAARARNSSCCENFDA